MKMMNEVPVPISHLEAIILGDYSPENDVLRVFLDNHPSLDDVGHTILHEIAHQRAIASTTFGEVQSLVAHAGMQADQRRILVPDTREPPWTKNWRGLIRQTIEASWFTHEGYAEYSARSALRRAGQASPPEPTVLGYARALTKFMTISDALPQEIGGLARSVVHSFMLIVLNTKILEECGLPDLETALRAHLALEANTPDWRLQTIVARIGKDFLSPECVEALRLGLLEILEDSGHQIAQSSFDGIDKELRKIELQPNGIHYKVSALVNDIVEKRCAQYFHDVPFVPWELAKATRHLFWQSAQDYLTGYGIELPSTRLVSSATLEDQYLKSDTIEFVNTNMFREVLLPFADLGVYSNALKEKPDLVYLAELGQLSPNPQYGNNQPLFSIGLIPLQKAGGQSLGQAQQGKTQGPVRVEPTLDKFTFWGPEAFFREVWTGFVSKIAVVVVALASVDFDTWQIDKALRDLLAEFNRSIFVVVPFTQGAWIHNLILKWKEHGVRAIWPVMDASGYEVFLFELENNVLFLVKLTAQLAGFYRETRPDLMEWFRSRLPPPEQIGRFASSVSPLDWHNAMNAALIEKLGGFRHPYNPPEYFFPR